MSFLDKIRKKSWLVISVIGLALLTFLIDPKSIVKFFSGDPTIIGKVNNEKISIQDYIQFQNLIEGIQKNNPNKPPQPIIEAKIWETLVNEKLRKEQIKKAGIKFPKKKEEEIYVQLLSMIGQGDKKKLSKEQEDSLKFQKELMINDALTNQYYEMIQKSIHTTSIESDLIQKEKDIKAKINYVVLPYREIEKNTKLEKNQDPFLVTKEETGIYFKANKKKFERKEETRDLNLVVFKAKLSKEDELKIEKQVNKLAEEFKSIKDHSIFTSSNSDFPTYDNARYLIGKNLPDELKNFFKKAPIGSVYGPKKENNSTIYLLAKLTDKKMISPSTKSSHILISYKGSERSNQKRSKEEAKKIADEFYKTIKASPKEFDNLVKKSDDPSQVQNKGSLGWVNYAEPNFVKEFQDFIDNHPKGHLGIVETPFGYHIARIDDKAPLEQAYQLAFIVKNIKPSAETEELLYKEAKKFVQENKNTDPNSFVANARKKDYKLILAQDMKASDFLIDGLGSSLDSEIINWAFEKSSKERTIKLFSSSNEGNHLVGYLGKIKPKGLPPIDENIQARINLILKKDKIFDHLKNENKKIEDLKKLGKVKKSEVDFYSSKILEEGIEPQVVAACLNLDLGKIHGPIKGEKGIYFLEITQRKAQKKLNSQDKPNELHNRNGYESFINTSMREKAIIKDYRRKKN